MGVEEALRFVAEKSIPHSLDEFESILGGDEAEGYEAETVADLKAELASRDLPTSGNKAELVARLEADDTSEGGGE